MDPRKDWWSLTYLAIAAVGMIAAVIVALISA